MKKQFLRVKQIADQTFLRAEKTEVLTEDLVTAEKRVDTIRISCQTSQKKISSCSIDFGSEVSAEKRLKKVPQIALGSSMLENGSNFSKNSVLGHTLKECSTVQSKLGNELLEYYNEVEKSVLKPLSSVLDNDIHNINKLRKNLGKLVLDMDSARTRYQTAEKHSLQTSSNASLNTMVKIDNLKDELEDASQKVEQCRDALATEMFSLISKEPHLAELFLQLHRIQADYHRNALEVLEANIPVLEQQISNFPQKPVYGCSLEDHLRVTNREIALVIEMCVSFLLHYGLQEEGLLRIAGSASKLKKLKSAFDAGIEIEMTEFVRDPHAVSGALKSYLRELPEPLMTYSLYDDWINAAKVQDFDAKLQALWQVLRKLPDSNFKNLQYVIKFLSKLHDNVSINKMSSQNIAIVMAPNLIWSESEDSSASFGMNMSTASLHTSVVDILISYCDWFFPDSEIPAGSKNANLNDSTVDLTEEFVDDESEINGNNQPVSALSKEDIPVSPRSLHRSLKKPAAPPPPAERSHKSESLYPSIPEAIPMGELIDFTCDSSEPPAKLCDKLVKKETFCSSKDSASAVIRRNSNENFNSSEMARRTPIENVNTSEPASKTERPSIPEKPPSYSSCSLDRRSQRQQIRGERALSHIERPSVPPPERPSKPPKFSSCEAVSPGSRKSTEVDDVFAALKSSQLTPSKEAVVQPATSQDDSQIPPAKPERSPATVQRSKSSTKINRFDFLVSQGQDKPPERPPRCIDSDKTAASAGITETDVASVVIGGDSVKMNVSSPESVLPPSMPPPVSPRLSDGEKPKPPRPQPPVPAKPKFNPTNENTSL